MLVRDYWPNAVCKWTKAVIESVDGSLTYSVLLDNGHSRQVHVDHIAEHPDLPALGSMITSASKSSGGLVDKLVENVPLM